MSWVERVVTPVLKEGEEGREEGARMCGRVKGDGDRCKGGTVCVRDMVG